MKISVARDMQMIMELLASNSKADLDEVWKEHEKFVQNFDMFAEAVLNGAETEEGMIHATDDQQLRDIVKEADQFHNDEFQPRIKQIYDIMIKKISGEPFSEEKLGQSDKEADNTGEKMLELIGTIEDIARKDIKESQARTAATTDFEIKLLAIAGAAGLAVSILLGFFMTKLITVPIFKARDFAGKIANGDLSQNIDIAREDEIGMLIRSLSRRPRPPARSAIKFPAYRQPPRNLLGPLGPL